MNVNCPYCRRAVALQAVDSNTEVHCPGCGSGFQVETDATVDWQEASSANREVEHATEGGIDAESRQPEKTLGKFVLLEAVGEGAFGAVYKARDSELDRTVAVKIPRGGSLPNSRDVDRFLREARSAAQLQHPAIVSVHEVGQHEGIPYLVSDFVEGRALSDVLHDGIPSTRQAAEWTAAVAEALRRWLNGETIRARAAGRLERAWRWSRRNPTVAGWIALVALSLLAVALISVSFGLYQSQVSAEQAAQRRASQLRSANLAFNEALGLCESGDTDAGMLRLARSLELAPSDATQLRRVIRMNLAGWRPSLHALKQILEHEDRVLALDVSPDGRLVLTGCADGKARLWERTTGRLLHTLNCGPPVTAAAFGPSGNNIAAASGADVLLWDWEQESVVGKLAGHEAPVLTLAFSHDGTRMATGGEDRTARVWDMQTLAESFSLDQVSIQHPGQGSSRWADFVGFCPRGKFLLSATRDAVAQLWRFRGAGGELQVEPIGPPFPHHGRIRPRFSPDGKTLLTGTEDGSLRLYLLPTHERPKLEQLWHNEDLGGITRLALSRDGKLYLVANDNGQIRLGQTQSGSVTREFEHSRLSDMAFSSDGRTVTTAGYDGNARRWDVQTGSELRNETRVLLPPDVASEVSVSADGRIVSLADNSGQAQLYHVSGKTIKSMIRHEGQLWSAGFSPSGRILMTGSADKTARLWRTDNGQPIGQPLRYPRPASRAAFSPDETLMVIGSDGYLARLWDVATSKPISQPFVHEEDRIAVAMHPTARYAATIDSTGNVRIWSVPRPVEDDPERIILWTQVITGLQLDAGDVVRRLDIRTWRQRRQRLEELDGPPIP